MSLSVMSASMPDKPESGGIEGMFYLDEDFKTKDMSRWVEHKKLKSMDNHSPTGSEPVSGTSGAAGGEGPDHAGVFLRRRCGDYEHPQV